MDTIENREKYRLLCLEEKTIPIFITYDWLNTVAKNKWDVLLEYRGEKIIAAMPYYINTNKGFKYIEQPSFTPTGGIWIRYDNEVKFSTKFRYEKEIINHLITQLPKFDLFYQKFHPSFTNWLPFYWNGFKQSTWYKYILKDISNHEIVFNNFDSETRRIIRKAEKKLNVTVSSSITPLIELKYKSYINKKTKIHFDENDFENIYSICQKKNIGELLIAKENDIIHAAGLFVWDSDTCYFLITASDPEYKNSGATSLIVWEAIKKYSSQVKALNLEGSMIPGIEEFLRGFGGEQIPYFVITKTNSKILKIKNFLQQF